MLRRKNQGRAKSSKSDGLMQLVRLPVSFVENTLRWIEFGNFAETPLYSPRISAKSHVEETLDADRYYARRSPIGFLVRDIGDAIIDTRINRNDMLLVDKKLSPNNGDIVVVAADGELILKRIFKKRGRLLLVTGNSKYPYIEIKDDNKIRILGVAMHVIYAWSEWNNLHV